MNRGFSLDAPPIPWPMKESSRNERNLRRLREDIHPLLNDVRAKGALSRALCCLAKRQRKFHTPRRPRHSQIS